MKYIVKSLKNGCYIGLAGGRTLEVAKHYVGVACNPEDPLGHDVGWVNIHYELIELHGEEAKLAQDYGAWRMGDPLFCNCGHHVWAFPEGAGPVPCSCGDVDNLLHVTCPLNRRANAQ